MNALAAEWVLWSAFAASWFLAALWAAPAAQRAPIGAQAPNLAVTAAGAFLLFSRTSRNAGWVSLWRTPEPLAWALVGLSALGFAFCWWARVHLGPLWSGTVTRKADHRIVDSGPYRLVRHPIYTGILIAAAALAAIQGAGAAILGLALGVLGFAMKARLEEGFLKAQLGAADYEAYAARTPMLFPWPARRKP
ncbi:MAG TPA: isoprenylcysteine carboxylmethyltransferase family protein [Caulobacteraceae bacterium]